MLREVKGKKVKGYRPISNLGLLQQTLVLLMSRVQLIQCPCQVQTAADAPMSDAEEVWVPHSCLHFTLAHRERYSTNISNLQGYGSIDSSKSASPKPCATSVSCACMVDEFGTFVRY